MAKMGKRLLNWLSGALVAAAVLLAAALSGVRLIGLKPFAVLSGSMEPAYPTGSLLYVAGVDVQALAPGDVITYLLDEDTVATHRIVEVVPDPADAAVLRFRTKGDANPAPDGALVHGNNVIGSPAFALPYLGYLAEFIRRPPGLYAAIGTGALLLLIFLPDLFGQGGESGEKGIRRKAPNRELPKKEEEKT